jgi:hypothetical protein
MNDHPLFPPMNDSEDSPEVTQIHVTRIEAGRPVYCPHLFGADELLSLEQVADMFGGGDYELVARDGKTFSARRRYTLPGKSRPLLIGNSVETNQETQVNVAVAPAAPQSEMMAFLGIITSQQNNMMAMLMKQSEVSMQTMATVISAALGGKGGDTSGIIQALQANSNTAMTSQTELFKAVLAAKGGDGVAAAKQILELAAMMKDQHGNNSDKDESDNIGDTLGQVVEALNMAGRLTGETEGVPIPDEVQVQ